MPIKDGRGNNLLIPFLLLMGLLLLFFLPGQYNLSFSQSSGKASAGKITYEKWCSSCHGKQGEGLGNMPSFRDTKHMAARTDIDLFNKITDGGQGTGMPPFVSRLAEEDRWNVIAYIRTLTPSK